MIYYTCMYFLLCIYKNQMVDIKRSGKPIRKNYKTQLVVNSLHTNSKMIIFTELPAIFAQKGRITSSSCRALNYIQAKSLRWCRRFRMFPGPTLLRLVPDPRILQMLETRLFQQIRQKKIAQSRFVDQKNQLKFYMRSITLKNTYETVEF